MKNILLIEKTLLNISDRISSLLGITVVPIAALQPIRSTTSIPNQKGG